MSTGIDTENKESFATLQNEKYDPNENNTTKSTLAQYIASLAVCLSSLTIGMMISYPTVAIGELRKSNHDFLLTEDEASWFGSLTYLMQPPCSVVGGILQIYIGRKHGMMLTYIPQLVGWWLLYFAKSAIVLYMSVILFGISVGSIEAPVIAYLGEITQPRMRSRLTSLASILINTGFLFSFCLGFIYNWRTVAACCAVIPIISIVTLFFLPDSPIWLLNRGRKEDALQSLCWLRGWVSPDCVQHEYKYMCAYIERSKLINSRKAESEQSFYNRLKNSVTIFTNPALKKPFVLIAVSHFACHGAALDGMRSYLIEILRTFHIPIRPEFFTFLSGILMICGGITCFLVIKVAGMRLTLLFSLMTCSLICIILSWYSYYMDEINMIWIPMAAILLLHLAMTIGLYPIPWMLTAEVFPLHGRSMATALVAASSYILGFVFSKTFYSLKNILQLSGCFLVYGLCGLLGFTYLYIKLPETEGKTLAEIEEYFSKPTKKPKVEVA